MTELSRVPGSPSPLQGRSGKVIAAIAVGIALAVVKPWGAVAPDQPLRTPPAEAERSSSAGVEASTQRQRVYDPTIFGIYEPQPDWGLWPAGYITSFGFAMRLNRDMAFGTPTPAPTPAPTRSSTSAPRSSAAASGDASASTPEAPPAWSGEISIGAGSSLTLLAINTPLGYSIDDAHLSRVVPGRPRQDVPIVRLPSPWPRHFFVVGVDDGTGTDVVRGWGPGAYALDVRIGPGGWSRTIHVIVAAPPPPPTPTPAPTVATPLT